jgi:hypothetical protein
MRKLLLTAATVVAFATPAFAGAGVSGTTLLKSCTAANHNACFAYILGVTDAGHKQMCLPDGITGVQLRTIVLTYLTRNPQRQSQAASDLVVEAINNVWPCGVVALNEESVVDLAEYAATCGNHVKPEVVRKSQSIVYKMGRDKFLDMVSRVHVQRSERAMHKYCEWMGDKLEDMGLLGPVDFRPASEIPPLPSDLDLSDIPRK